MEEKGRKFKTMWHLECKPGEHTLINSIFSGETLKVFEHDKNISYLVFQKGHHLIMCNMDVRAVLITFCCITNHPIGSRITQQPFYCACGFSRSRIWAEQRGWLTSLLHDVWHLS